MRRAFHRLSRSAKAAEDPGPAAVRAKLPTLGDDWIPRLRGDDSMEKKCISCPLTIFLPNPISGRLVRREGRHLQRRLLTERARVLRVEVRHFCSQTAWASARPARDRTVGCPLHWHRIGSADLSMTRWFQEARPGPGWKATSSNPHSGAPRGDRPLS